MHRLRRRLPVGLFLLAPLFPPALPAQEAADLTPDQALVELLAKRDDADPKLIDKVANAGGMPMAEGLVRLYDDVTTIYMRREVISALGSFAGSGPPEGVAMSKLANIAANEVESELREQAVKQLGRSSGAGKELLKQLVDSDVDDAIRLLALQQHRKHAGPEDQDWYRFLWNLKAEQRKDDKGQIEAPELPTIREEAFAQLAKTLGEEELVETLRREQHPKIRRAALRAMADRDLPKTADMAEWVLGRVDFPGQDRAEAARILVQSDDKKAVATFLKLAKKRDVTPEDLRAEMARLIAGIEDAATRKKVGRLVGKGKPHEKVFALLAVSNTDDPKVLATVRKGLGDKEPEVRRAAAQVLGMRRDRDSLDALREMLRQPEQPGDMRTAIEAISMIEPNSSTWHQELAEFATHADPEVRNAALDQLAAKKDKKLLPLWFDALDHEDWSTRLIAIEALEKLRQKEAVPKLIERLPKDPGRLGRRIADALWQLTAQSYGEDVDAWRGWWAAAEKDFKVATERDLDKAEREREMKRLKQRTSSKAKFFGIKVESRRVIFIVDTSGSMLESLYGHQVDGRRAARIDVAKHELSQAISNLEPGTLFNVLAFSSGIDRWKDQGMAANDPQNRDAALTWVSRLGAAGGTNLYDTLHEAFQDKEVDTIFVLSDGEPTVGAVIDAYRIREDVAHWNEHRRIVINTIAIGGNLEVLEWLAEDSGGDHRRIR